MAKESLKLQAYNIIREKIINCEYAPNTLLNEEILREDINASRTPIRDALSRLEQEGLIIIMPKKGIMVSSLSITDVNTIFEVRMLIEPYALQNYGYTISDHVYMDFVAKFNEFDDNVPIGSFFQMDDDFHLTIVNANPNRYLLQTYEKIQTQNLRFRVMTGQFQKGRLEATKEQHLAIVKACLKKDWQMAASEMKEHLISSKSSTFDLLLNMKNPPV